MQEAIDKSQGLLLKTVTRSLGEYALFAQIDSDELQGVMVKIRREDNQLTGTLRSGDKPEDYSSHR
jgi:hypothetical protein